MRALIILALCLLSTMPAWAAGADLKPSQIFAADSPSFVVVVAYGENGEAIAQGSGVVIAKDTVVSNCHVIEKANTASVLYQKKHLAATLRYEDSERDLCSFTVKALSAPPVCMGYTSQVQVGDAAYAIGAPEGLDLTLSGGLISSLRKIPGGVVLQMTTPISPGSSGGGLFDAQGRLIGITSYYMSKGEQLNFALPVEWVNELPQRSKLASVNKPRIASTAGATQGSELQNGIRALHAGDYTAAFETLTRLARERNAVALFYLGVMYYGGDGVQKDEARAVTWWRKAAAQGYALAQYNLGLMYYGGQGVPHDYARTVAWWRRAAAQGLAEAQYNLGVMYEDGQGVPQDYTQAIAWYSKAAAQGFALAEDNLGVMYDNGWGVPQDYAQAVAWYRKAVAQGSAMAQGHLGAMYTIGRGVPQDFVEAYALVNLSASLKSTSENQAASLRNDLIHLMTPEQITAGQALTREMQRVGVIKALDEYSHDGSQ